MRITTVGFKLSSWQAVQALLLPVFRALNGVLRVNTRDRLHYRPGADMPVCLFSEVAILILDISVGRHPLVTAAEINSTQSGRIRLIM